MTQTQPQAQEDTLKHKRIHFIGGGNMAQALISGLLAKGVEPSNITIADPAPSIHEQMAPKKVTCINPLTEAKAAKNVLKAADVVILAVKPQVMAAVVSGFDEDLQQQLVISVAAGLSTQALSQMLGGYKTVVRAMPNTPAMIQKGATGLYAGEHITQAQKQLAGDIMAAAGLVSWAENEEQLHAVTAISGSAPAYFFYMLESMINAGTALGLDEEQASALAMQTALGAAQMAIDSHETPAMLRHKVTSPNGTTQAAIESLQDNQFSQTIEKAMQACYARSEVLSATLGKLPK